MYSVLSILFLILFLLANPAQTQTFEIIEILDSNLFKTEDSMLISMVNLETPSLSDDDSSRQALAELAVKYARINLLNHKCRFEAAAKSSCSETDIQKGHLYRSYPLSEDLINLRYIENGYALYVPCDTMFMAEYGKAAIDAIDSKRGIFKPNYPVQKPDYFNRLRTSWWLFYLETDDPPKFPIVGFNYRWSDLISIYNSEIIAFNISAEVGTFVYFFLPYANIGTEIRDNRFYLRGNYNAVLPFIIFYPDNIDSLDFWGLDIGFMIPIGKRSGIELEYNLRGHELGLLNLISVNFTVY